MNPLKALLDEQEVEFFRTQKLMLHHPDYYRDAVNSNLDRAIAVGNATPEWKAKLHWTFSRGIHVGSVSFYWFRTTPTFYFWVGRKLVVLKPFSIKSFISVTKT